MFDDCTTINGMRVPLSAMRYHPPHRLDRPSRALPIWFAIACAAWLLALVRAW